MVTSPKTGIDYHIPSQNFLICEELIQLCITPAWLTQYLCIITDTLQESPGLFMSRHVAL